MQATSSAKRSRKRSQRTSAGRAWERVCVCGPMNDGKSAGACCRMCRIKSLTMKRQKRGDRWLPCMQPRVTAMLMSSMLVELWIRRRRVTSVHSRARQRTSLIMIMTSSWEMVSKLFSRSRKITCMVRRRRRERAVMQDRIMTWRWRLL